MAKNFNELDVVCHVNKSGSKTLATSAEFYANHKEDELPFRESNLSRLDLSLITKVGDKKDVLIFNIPAREINEIKLKTDIVVGKLMLSAMPTPGQPPVDGDGFKSSPAFTVPLMLNAFKGRTPGEVLSSDPSKKGELLNGKKWLEDNLAKYPKNQNQIDAINDAIMLLEIGEIGGDSSDVAIPTSPSGVLTIYKREFKYKSKKDENGNNLVYSVTITCDPSRNLPFIVEVMNCYAPVVASGGGQTLVKTGAAVNTRRSNIALSDSEWIGLVYQAYDLYQNFKRCHAPAAFKRAAENSYSPN